MLAYKEFWQQHAGAGIRTQEPLTGTGSQEVRRAKLFNFEEEREDFYRWLTTWEGKIRIYGTVIKKRAISESTARDYVNKLSRVLGAQDVRTLEDFEKLFEDALESGELKKGWNNWAKGLRNYMQYLFLNKRIDESTYFEIIDAFAEIKSTGTRDIDLKNEEIAEAYEYIAKNGNRYDLVLFKLLVYSGLRLAHVLRALHAWNPNNIRVYGEVAVYNMELAEGNKKAFIMLFPAKMLNEIERFPQTYTYDVARKHINYKRVTAIAIRHWHYNFLILDNGVPEGVANFIQGRSPENVGSANYLAKVRGAIEHYSRILSKFPI